MGGSFVTLRDAAGEDFIRTARATTALIVVMNTLADLVRARLGPRVR